PAPLYTGVHTCALPTSRATLLEVGVGTGVVIRALAALVGRRGRVVGLDPSRVILGEARRLCRTAKGGRVTLREGNGAELPFADGSFDVTLAITVILHVAGPLPVVGEVTRVSRRAARGRLQGRGFG